MFAVDWKEIDCSFRFEFFRSFRCCSFHFTGRFQIFHSNAFKQRKMRMMKMKWIFSEEAIFYLSYSAVRPFVISNARRLKHVSCHRDATWGWEGRWLGGFWSGSLVLSSWSAGSKNKTFLNIRLWLQPSDQWRGVSCVWVCASVSVLINAHNCTYINAYTHVCVYKQLANCPTAGVADGLTSSPASLELKRIPSRTAQANYVQVYVHLCCIWVCVPPPSPSLLPITIIIIGPALLDPARNGSSYESLCVCAFKWCRCSKCSSCCCDVAAFSVPLLCLLRVHMPHFSPLHAPFWYSLSPAS